jgi:hypothetical protein
MTVEQTAEEIRELDESDSNMEGSYMVGNCEVSSKILPAQARSGDVGSVYCFIGAMKTGLVNGKCTKKPDECGHLMYSADIIK